MAVNVLDYVGIGIDPKTGKKHAINYLPKVADWEDAKRNAALQVLQSQKEEYKAYLQGGERGLADYYKQAHGFTMEDLRMTPEQLAGFQQARKSMLENLLPNFRDPETIAREQEMMRQNFRASMDGKEYFGRFASGRFGGRRGLSQEEARSISENVSAAASSEPRSGTAPTSTAGSSTVATRSTTGINAKRLM